MQIKRHVFEFLSTTVGMNSFLVTIINTDKMIFLQIIHTLHVGYMLLFAIFARLTLIRKFPGYELDLWRTVNFRIFEHDQGGIQAKFPKTIFREHDGKDLILFLLCRIYRHKYPDLKNQVQIRSDKGSARHLKTENLKTAFENGKSFG